MAKANRKEGKDMSRIPSSEAERVRGGLGLGGVVPRALVRDIEDNLQWVVTSGRLISITVCSRGVRGSEWSNILRARGLNIERAKQLFDRLMAEPTNNVRSSLMVIPGRLFDSDDVRILAMARVRARHLGLVSCDPEQACLVAQLIKTHDFNSMGFKTLVFICEYGMCVLEGEHGKFRFTFDQMPMHKQWPEDTGFVFLHRPDPASE